MMHYFMLVVIFLLIPIFMCAIVMLVVDTSKWIQRRKLRSIKDVVYVEIEDLKQQGS